MASIPGLSTKLVCFDTSIVDLTDQLADPVEVLTSTLCGQPVNTAVFYVFGLWGMIPNRVLTKSIVVASITKVTVELLLLPVTLKVSLWLKRIENVDYFDRGTNFNPLTF